MSKLLLVLVAVAFVAVVSAQSSVPVPPVADPVLPGSVSSEENGKPPKPSTPLPPTIVDGDDEYPKAVKVVHYRKGSKHTHNHREEELPTPTIRRNKYPLVKPKKENGPRTPRGLFPRKTKKVTAQAKGGKKVRARIVRRPSGSRPARVHARLRDDHHEHEFHSADHVHVHHHHTHEHVEQFDDVHHGDHEHVIPHHSHHKQDAHQVAGPLVIGNLHDYKHKGLAMLHEHVTNAHDVHIHLGDHTTIRPNAAKAAADELKLITQVVDEHIRS